MVEPAGAAVHPLPVELPVPFERLGPAPDRIAALLNQRHGPVLEGYRRALLQQPGVVLPPAVVTFDHPVEAQAGSSRQPLQVLDGELCQ